MRHQGAITITQRSYTMRWKNFLIRIFDSIIKSTCFFPKYIHKVFKARTLKKNIVKKVEKNSKIVVGPFLSFWIFALCQQGVLAFRDFTIRDLLSGTNFVNFLWKRLKNFFLNITISETIWTHCGQERGEWEYHALLINITCWWASM